LCQVERPAAARDHRAVVNSGSVAPSTVDVHAGVGAHQGWLHHAMTACATCARRFPTDERAARIAGMGAERLPPPYRGRFIVCREEQFCCSPLHTKGIVEGTVWTCP